MSLFMLAIIPMLSGFTTSPQLGQLDPRCGSHCLLVALKAMGLETLTSTALEESLGPPGEKGYSLEDLNREAKRRGLHTLGVETTLDHLQLREKPFACITLVRGNHFVLLYDIDSENAYLIDPPREYTLPIDTFLAVWSRQCLLISKAPLVDELELNQRSFADRFFLLLIVLAILLAIGCAIFVMNRWRKKLATSVALVFVSLCLTGCGSGWPESSTHRTPPPSGGLIVEPSEHDLGEVTKVSVHSTCEARTVIRNTGKRAVRILELVKSCSCTKARLSSEVIEPGASVDLIAEFSLGNTEENRAASIEVRTDDNQQPARRVVYRWRTRNVLHTNPLSLSLGKVRPGDPAQSSAEVVASSSILCDQCRFEAVSRTPDLSVELLMAKPWKVQSSSRETVVGSLVVKLMPGFESGGRSSLVEMTLHCKGEQRARLDIPVNWSIVTDYQVIPTRVSLGLVSPGAEATARVILISEQERAFQVRGARLESASALIGFAGGETPKASHECRVTVRMPHKAGLWSSTLTVETDDPKSPMLRIPISALVEPSR